MPELPEVETTTKGLRRTIIGRIIKNVWTDLTTMDRRKADTAANTGYFKYFKNEILNRKVLAVQRRAKNILINLSGGKTILVHMKMTGHLLYGEYKFQKKENKWIPEKKGPLSDPFNRFIHVVFEFDGNRQLAFSDARKFGKITLLGTESMHQSKHLAMIGPEPLDRDFRIENLVERLQRSKNKKVKTALMDQSVLSGIGNIYSDEILWHTGVHPERKVADLRRAEIRLMLKMMKKILAKGIDFGGDSMSDYRNIDGKPGKFQLHHMAYRKTGEKCAGQNCSGVIQRKIVNGRSAHFCSAHQK